MKPVRPIPVHFCHLIFYLYALCTPPSSMVCKLQVHKLVLIEFTQYKYQKMSTSDVKNNSYLQMDIFYHFDFCHSRKNAFCTIKEKPS